MDGCERMPTTPASGRASKHMHTQSRRVSLDAGHTPYIHSYTYLSIYRFRSLTRWSSPLGLA